MMVVFRSLKDRSRSIDGFSARKKFLSILILSVVILMSCSFGPRELQQGHLAYNAALKATTDEELLLNIVRLRYLDTLEFLETTAISAQSSFSASLGATLGTNIGDKTNLAIPGVAYSTRPTFTFIPTRGQEFAENLMRPLGPDILGHLFASNWDIYLLYRLFVREMNGLVNGTAWTDQEFVRIAEIMGRMQHRNELFLGTIEKPVVLSDPINTRQVTGSDLVEAARSGYRFKHDPGQGTFVLTGTRSYPFLYIKPNSKEIEIIIQLLKLELNPEGYYELRAGASIERKEKKQNTIFIRSGSLLDAILYLSQGVQVPESHLREGLTSRDWPVPGLKSLGLEGFFLVRFSEEKPKASLAVRYRDYWFYLAEDDHESRSTFQALAQVFRLGLTESKSEKVPVLTLPVGGP